MRTVHEDSIKTTEQRAGGSRRSGQENGFFPEYIASSNRCGRGKGMGRRREIKPTSCASGFYVYRDEQTIDRQRR